MRVLQGLRLQRVVWQLLTPMGTMTRLVMLLLSGMLAVGALALSLAASSPPPPIGNGITPLPLQRWCFGALRLRGCGEGPGLPPSAGSCGKWPLCGLREVLRQGGRVKSALTSLNEIARMWLAAEPPQDLEAREEEYDTWHDSATMTVARANGRLQRIASELAASVCTTMHACS